MLFNTTSTNNVPYPRIVSETCLIYKPIRAVKLECHQFIDYHTELIIHVNEQAVVKMSIVDQYADNISILNDPINFRDNKKIVIKLKNNTDKFIRIEPEEELFIFTCISYDNQQAADEEAAKQAADEEAAQKLADEEAAQKLADEEAAKKLADDEAAQKLAEEEAAKKLAEEEAVKQAEEEAAKKLAEEEAMKQVDNIVEVKSSRVNRR